MGELLGITGAIGAGKTTLGQLLGEVVENHAMYESSWPITEVANRFNQLLEAELNFETTDNDIEMINQALIWMPDVISEHLHFETTWNHLALAAKDMRAHPELYEKLLAYVARARKSPGIVEQTITSANKSDYRDLLQGLGGYFVAKLSPTIWYDELFRRIDTHDSRRDLVIINGVRYMADAAAVREHGGRIIRIERAGLAQHTDVTEAELTKYVPDITIINNGTSEQLQALAEVVWNDIAAGNPKKEYRAS